MPDVIIASSTQTIPGLWWLAVAGVVLLAAGGALWGYYGTAVFFDMLAAGLAYCF